MKIPYRRTDGQKWQYLIVNSRSLSLSDRILNFDIHSSVIDIGELAFRFLGVNTDGCRKRFVCELDIRAQTNPITRLAFSFIG